MHSNERCVCSQFRWQTEKKRFAKPWPNHVSDRRTNSFHRLDYVMYLFMYNLAHFNAFFLCLFIRSRFTHSYVYFKHIFIDTYCTLCSRNGVADRGEHWSLVLVDDVNSECIRCRRHWVRNRHGERE